MGTKGLANQTPSAWQILAKHTFEQLYDIVLAVALGFCALPYSCYVFFRVKFLPPSSHALDSIPKRKSTADHQRDVAALTSQLDAAYRSNSQVCVGRKPAGTGTTARSNLYKHSLPVQLDFSRLNCLIGFDAKGRTATVEPGVTFSSLCSLTLRHGLLPPVCPELRKITVGGAISGIGIESTSIHWRTVDTHVVAANMLVPTLPETGSAGITSKDEAPELWNTSVGSCGSVSLLTQATLRLYPATKWIKLRYVRYDSHQGFVQEVMDKRRSHADSDESWVSPDILADAIAFDNFTVGMFGGCVSEAEAQAWKGPIHIEHAGSNFFYQHVKQIGGRPPVNSDKRYEKHGALVHEELIPTIEYLFRYDRSGFWAAEVVSTLLPPLKLVLENALIRFVMSSLLATSTLMKLTKLFPDRQVENLALFQDVSVPLLDRGQAVDDFMNWLDDVRPVWLCPIRTGSIAGRVFATTDCAAHDCEMDLGFYGIPKRKKASLRQLNIELEERMAAAGGRKGLYAFVYASREKFWQLYDRRRYDESRARYGGDICLVDLYDKTASKSA